MSIAEDTQVADAKPNRPPPAYSGVGEWVSTWLAPKLERDIKRTFQWCPQWWAHPEAVERLESLWRAWETLRLDPGTGMSTWWVDHADPMLAILCNPDVGPFGHCHGEHRSNRHPLEAAKLPDPWPLRPGPEPSQTSAFETAMGERDGNG